jgi:hypothetical protein
LQQYTRSNMSPLCTIMPAHFMLCGWKSGANSNLLSIGRRLQDCSLVQVQINGVTTSNTKRKYHSLQSFRFITLKTKNVARSIAAKLRSPVANEPDSALSWQAGYQQGTTVHSNHTWFDFEVPPSRLLQFTYTMTQITYHAANFLPMQTA